MGRADFQHLKTYVSIVFMHKRRQVKCSTTETAFWIQLCSRFASFLGDSKRDTLTAANWLLLCPCWEVKWNEPSLSLVETRGRQKEAVPHSCCSVVPEENLWPFSAPPNHSSLQSVYLSYWVVIGPPIGSEDLISCHYSLLTSSCCPPEAHSHNSLLQCVRMMQ